MCKRVDSTNSVPAVEYFFKKLRFYFVTFLKSVITGSRRVNFIPAKLRRKERKSYGKL